MKTALENLSKKEMIRLLLQERKQAETILLQEIQKQDQEIKKQDQEIKKQDQEIKKSIQEIEYLRYQIAQLKRMYFGSKRERFIANENQLKIEFEQYASEQEKQDQTPVKETITYQRSKPSNHNGRSKIADHLPVIEHVIEPLEDTTSMKRIGEERTEILEFVPEKFFKLVLIRPKYARKEQLDEALRESPKSIVIAPLPSRPLPKCLAGTRLLTVILVQKFIDHLPLYRQQQIFKRAGIDIASSTIDTWVAQLARLLELLYEKLITEIKHQQYLQVDETTIKVLDNTKKQETHLGFFWVYHAPLSRLVAFDYQKGRGKAAPRSFLEGYKGTLQTDGYAVYKHYYNNKAVMHLACWAHVRRKFEKALQSNRSLAEHVLTEIQKLYAIERDVKELSAERRKEIRLEKALPIINQLGKWFYDQKQVVLPKSPFGQALEYTIPLWESLQNYLHDGNLQIDNNLIENTIRPVALGRKNYLFAGSHEGAHRAAMFYSFFACCKLNNINPQKWLEYVLTQISETKMNDLHKLLPNHIDPASLENFKHFWEV
jgi:transposase